VTSCRGVYTLWPTRHPHASNPLPHRRAPARHHRQAHAHEPHLPTPDAHGAPGPRIGQATASPAPVQDVARLILGEDATQIEYNSERIIPLVGKVHLQRHQPLRPERQRPCGRRVAERQQARRAPAAVPPAPRCLPNAARRGGLLFAHAEDARINVNPSWQTDLLMPSGCSGRLLIRQAARPQWGSGRAAWRQPGLLRFNLSGPSGACRWAAQQNPVDLPGNEPFEAAQDFGF